MARVYVDTCILIYLVEGEPELSMAVQKWLAMHRPTVCVSDLTRLECRVRPLRLADQELLAWYESLLSLPDVEAVALSREVFDLAAELSARYRLKTPDAIHAAAAISAGCSALWTNDDRFHSVPNLKVEMLPG